MEKLLLINLPDAACRVIQGVASRLKVATDRVGKEYFDQTLKMLAGGKYRQTSGTAQSKEVSRIEDAARTDDPAESLIVLCGLRDKRLDKVLFELKRADVSVDYKAILTPVNESWTIPVLMAQLRCEKTAMQAKQTKEKHF